MRCQYRIEADILAVAVDDELHHRGIAVAGQQPLADDEPQVARQSGIAVVDGLVLADEAAQLRRNVAGPLLEHRVVENLIRIDGQCRKGRERQQHCEQQRLHSAGAVLAGAGRGAPTRSRR